MYNDDYENMALRTLSPPPPPPASLLLGAPKFLSMAPKKNRGVGGGGDVLFPNNHNPERDLLLFSKDFSNFSNFFCSLLLASIVKGRSEEKGALLLQHFSVTAVLPLLKQP